MHPDSAPPRTAAERLCHHLAHLPAAAPLVPAALAAEADTTPTHAAQVLAALVAEAIIAPGDRLRVLDPRTLARLAGTAAPALTA